MPHPILRFVQVPDGAETSYTQIVFENVGVTMFHAQMIEDNLCLILSGLEALGLVHIDREAYKIKVASDGIIEACIGSMVYILQEHSRFDMPRDFFKHLKKANMQRNMLAHRFFMLNARDLSTDSGCARIAKKLLPIYEHLVKVNMMLEHLRDVVYDRLGFSPEEAQRQSEELLRELRANEPNDDAI
jgi:hypothetical protein